MGGSRLAMSQGPVPCRDPVSVEEDGEDDKRLLQTRITDAAAMKDPAPILLDACIDVPHVRGKTGR